MTGTGRQRDERPRLLWIAHQPPLPPTEGSRLRTVSLLASLAPEFALTVVVLAGGPGDDPGAQTDERLRGLRIVDAGGSRLGQLAAAPHLATHVQPPVLRHYAQRRQRRVVRDLLLSGEFTGVVADTIYAAAALPPRRPGRPGQLPLVINTHNVEREIWANATADVSGGPFRLALDRRLAPRWEVAALDAADGAAFCSERDRDALAPALRPGLELAVVPNTVDVGRLRPLPPVAEMGQVLFIGNLAYEPNAEAVRFIRDRLSPALAGSGVSFVVAGGELPGILGSGTGVAAERDACFGRLGTGRFKAAKHQPAAEYTRALRLAKPEQDERPDEGGVRFAGRPDDLTPLYRESFAVVVPLFHGSGTRLKVLEALALGRPLVATAKAVEGLGLRPEHEYLAAEDEAAFAAQLGRLREEPALRDQLVAAGRLAVEQRFSWAVAGRTFRALLRRCGV